MVNPRVFFDITIGGKSSGQIVIELFPNTDPKPAQIFLSLCTGERGKSLDYKGSTFRRIGGNLCQAGEISDAMKRRLQVLYGLFPKPVENVVNKSSSDWMVSFGGSCFYISGSNMPCLNGVVGRVVEGVSVVKDVCRLRKTPVVIANCGRILPDRVPRNSASQKTSTTKLKQVISASNKKFSTGLKDVRNVAKQLTGLDSRDVLVSENETELEDFAGMLEHNLGTLSDLKTEVSSLEKCQNELLSQTRTRISNIKNTKLVLEMIASLPDDNLENIETALKKRKRDSASSSHAPNS